MSRKKTLGLCSLMRARATKCVSIVIVFQFLCFATRRRAFSIQITFYAFWCKISCKCASFDVLKMKLHNAQLTSGSNFTNDAWFHHHHHHFIPSCIWMFVLRPLYQYADEQIFKWTTEQMNIRLGNERSVVNTLI